MNQRKTWTENEDNFITLKIQQLQDKIKPKWGDIAKQLNLTFQDSHRAGKQCRQRWHNQLNPAILHTEWSADEQNLLIKLQKQLGNRWAEIAQNIEGRTDNNVKNFFYSTLRKSLRKLNIFISLNRNELKNAKQFKDSSLSKLLAVAEHKFAKKINVKKDTAEDEAIEIKNLLLDIARFEVNDLNAKPLFLCLAKKLQQWSKCCKKKKGKKKQQIEAQEKGSQNQSLEKQDQLKNANNKLKKIINLKKIAKQMQRCQLKYRSHKKNVRMKNKLNELQNFKQIQTETKLKSSNLSSNNFDHNQCQQTSKNTTKQSQNLIGNLFKGFVHSGEFFQSNQQVPSEDQKAALEKAKQSKINAKKSGSGLEMIKQVSFRQNSNQMQKDQFLEENEQYQNFEINMLRKQSSKFEIPFLLKEESLCFGSLDQSLRFDPPIRNMESLRKNSSINEMQYRFDNPSLN